MRTITVLLLLALLVSTGCTPDDTDTAVDTADSGDTDDTGDTDDSGDTDDTGDTGPAGLTERPANPDCVAFARPSSPTGVRLVQRYPNIALTGVTTLVPDPLNGGWIAITQDGRVWRWDDREDATAELMVDIRGVVDNGPNEAGLLGLALHPDVASNGEVFLSYTTQTRAGLTSRFSRVKTTDDLKTLDVSEEEVLLEVAQPYGNHNGGHIAFGPDGFLYIALGDGGSGGDPLGSGQDTDTLLGAILRIDVDSGSPYGIPADNPFAEGGGRSEIFAWGLRNPWSFAFDPATGALWAGDVGQNALEEIDLVELGGNYGWNVKEGDQCYRSETCPGSFVEPVVVYGRDQGQSVTGGVVVRGGPLSGSLEGSYLYTDFRSQRLWAVVYDPDSGDPGARLLIDGTGLAVAAFGQALDGRVMLANYGRNVYELVPEDGEVVQAPATLSATGCADASDPTLPSSGMVPFEPRHPFWSDDADKRRWVAIPDAAVATVREDGDVLLPVGSVLRKDFHRAGERISTRLLVHHTDGWAGYVYRWRPDGSDADLIAAGTEDVGGGPWHFPSQATCAQCHTEAAGRSLGLDTAQLAHVLDYGDGRPIDQRIVLDRIGLVDGLDLEADPLPTRAEAGGARAWLHVNCSSCHRPGGSFLDLDFRVTTPLNETGACDTRPERGDLGVTDARIIAPGAPERSVVLTRIHDLGAWRMPPEGSLRVDEEGAGLVEEWIRGLSGCE